MSALPRPIPKRDCLVLLVEPDADEREQFGSWLEAAGYGVINCPGPPGAGMVCLGLGSGGRRRPASPEPALLILGLLLLLVGGGLALIPHIALGSFSFGTKKLHFLDDRIELRSGKIAKTTDVYGAPLDAPPWRSKWVERIT